MDSKFSDLRLISRISLMIGSQSEEQKQVASRQPARSPSSHAQQFCRLPHSPHAARWIATPSVNAGLITRPARGAKERAMWQKMAMLMQPESSLSMKVVLGLERRSVKSTRMNTPMASLETTLNTSPAPASSSGGNRLCPSTSLQNSAATHPSSCAPRQHGTMRHLYLLSRLSRLDSVTAGLMLAPLSSPEKKIAISSAPAACASSSNTDTEQLQPQANRNTAASSNRNSCRRVAMFMMLNSSWSKRLSVLSFSVFDSFSSSSSRESSSERRPSEPLIQSMPQTSTSPSSTTIPALHFDRPSRHSASVHAVRPPEFYCLNNKTDYGGGDGQQRDQQLQGRDAVQPPQREEGRGLRQALLRTRRPRRTARHQPRQARPPPRRTPRRQERHRPREAQEVAQRVQGRHPEDQGGDRRADAQGGREVQTHTRAGRGRPRTRQEDEGRVQPGRHPGPQRPRRTQLNADNLRRLDALNDKKDFRKDKSEREREKPEKPEREKGKAKPAWALTKEQVEQTEEKEVDELLDFFESNNVQEYSEDEEVKELLSSLKAKIERMKESEDWREKEVERIKGQREQREAKPEGEDDKYSQFSGGHSEGRSVASEKTQKKLEELRAKKQQQEWDKFTTSQKTAVNVDDRIAKNIADEVLRNYPNLKGVHSNVSIRRLLEAEAARVISEPIVRPVITTVVREKQPINANTLPYLHRNPAI